MSDKKRRTLIIVLCILAVVIAIAAIFLAPFGKKGANVTTDTTITSVPPLNAQTTAIPTDTESTEQTTQPASEITTVTSETSLRVPPSTDAVVNPNKNYTFFIDKSMFKVSESEDGSTTLVAEKNSNVKMVVTPTKDKSYAECCQETEKQHKKLGTSARLDIVNKNSVYRSQTGDTDDDIITTVYCIDDGKGGCIVINYEAPVAATKYTKTVEIMLSMFKVL